jgi:hypothetical protein
MATRTWEQLTFTFAFGQKVRIRPPHPDAGATGEVMNAYLYHNDRKERVFVAVPGGDSGYEAEQLEAIEAITETSEE